MNTSVQLNSVFFGNDELQVINEANELWVPLKPISSALGLEWEPQRKLIERDAVLSSTTSIMEAVEDKTDNKKQQIAYAKRTLELEMIAKQVAGRIHKGHGNLEDYAITTELYALIRAELSDLNKNSLFQD